MTFSQRPAVPQCLSKKVAGTKGEEFYGTCDIQTIGPQTPPVLSVLCAVKLMTHLGANPTQLSRVDAATEQPKGKGTKHPFTMKRPL